MLTAADKRKLRELVRSGSLVSLTEGRYGDTRWIAILGGGAIGHTSGFGSNYLSDPGFIAAQARFKARWEQAEQIIAEEQAKRALAQAGGEG